ncbi:hypothetical protein CHGG_02766 [Chaetomium globosum CBS 148.51]|uniref:DUF3824 domain-containing protein n=1 Tax=Chaetomium globosum (strain ATCC 6205 / CBS 148.51 / DSM 1962 / NBRC 6347 / NRRL 1970) TaxID=306901 RepID=Q2HAI8_CHAGB|nr:uncharacterized protein CHGG_02766 [Chaetomium globosum CBS 148.51]EAQ90831.1 hypothetical protein CHGG_02766 [Chaetomium globosum CBS 148.51]
MASYDPYDAPPRERTTKRYYREERREERDPRYYESRETLHVQPSRDLVPRAREDSDLSVEEIRRDFPPPGYSSRDLRRARSAEPGYYDEYDDRRSYYSRDRNYDDLDRKSRKKTDVVYEEERKKARVLSKQEQIIAAVTGAALAIGGKELYDRRDANQHGTEVQRNILASAALGAAGALAGYQGTEFYNKHKEKEERKALAHRSGYYSDDEESAKEKKGHKNFLESALAAAGLGGAVKALTGKDDKSDTRSRRGSRSRSRSRSTSRSRGRDKSRDGKSEGASKVQKAAMASLIAGATEAFRISKQPGSWKGEKAKRILTAAAGAATLDAAQDTEKAGSKLGLTEAVVGGLLGNRVINGSKKNIEMDEKTGRSRSRSRARSKDGSGGGGGVSGLAALATAGLGAFGAKKIMDNRERSRSRRRSVDSRDDSPDRRHRSRSRSVVDSARRRLARVGIGNGPDDDDRDRRDRSRSRDRRRDQDDYEDTGRSRRHRDSYDDYDRDRRRHSYDDDRSHRGGGHDRPRHRRGSVSSDDLGDSDDDRKRGKKLRGKISEEQAEKLKNKAILQDAAAVGIAALGIKGAISEVKEANELRHEMHQWKLEKQERHQRRVERQRRLANGGLVDHGGGTGQLVRRRADSWDSVAPPGASRYDDGPRYVDGNPYGAMPPGPSDRR